MSAPALPVTPAIRRDAAFLPDFCEQGNLLRTMLVAELLAFIIVAAQPVAWLERLQILALVSLFIQWVALVDIALLCMLQQRLARLDDRIAAGLAFLLLQGVTAAFTVMAHGLAARMGLPTGAQPLAAMLAEHGVISAIVTAIALRYFYVTAQWRRNVEAEAQSRVQALQARIRPHFLFNSMNTIASLTRSAPEQAESAVEDLAELFRASLADRSTLTLEEELALVASYLRIEGQRLSDRLTVDWAHDPATGGAELPALTLQPLVENAVYHGAEQLPGGGHIAIRTRRDGESIVIEIDNPRPRTTSPREGHRMAQDNVRQRLALAFGEAGALVVSDDADRYRVAVRIPAPPEAPA
ncbi:MAG: histidine kinase [Halofilum sp. (in: g-proteobacteria)]